jgi:hypothetical protein
MAGSVSPPAKSRSSASGFEACAVSITTANALGGYFSQQIETVDPRDVQDGQVIAMGVHLRGGGVGGRPIDPTSRGIIGHQLLEAVQDIGLVVHGENAFAV